MYRLVSFGQQRRRCTFDLARRLRAHLAINPVGPLKKWLDAQEKHFGIAQEDEMKQSFDFQLRAIQALVSRPSPDVPRQHRRIPS